jgi:ATP-dependent helicase/nuclease subunit B
MEFVPMSCKTLASLEDYDTILTVNQRLSRVIQREFDQRAIKTQRAWTIPRILPYSGWLKSTWQQHADKHILLSNWQELNLWKQVISEDTNHINLNPIKTAKLCQQTATLMHNWHINMTGIEYENHDVMTFIQWYQSFMLTLQDHQWITESMISNQLAHCDAAFHSMENANIALLGFDEITPQQQSIIDLLQQQAHVDLVNLALATESVQTTKFHSFEDEMQHIVNWAQQLSSHTSIAVIIPNLAQCRTTVKRLTDQFPVNTFNISGGQPLTQFPIIQSAISALALSHHQIESDQAYQWLQSPYLTQGSIEIEIGAWIDKQLREQQQHTIAFIHLYEIIKQSEDALATTWLSRLRTFSNYVASLPQQCAPSAWAQHWLHGLNAIGWPGGRTLNSEEYQLFEKFKQSLQEFSALDLIYDTLPLHTALTSFKQLLSNTLFQREGSTAPIQILGLLECAGMQFDHLWLASMDAETWPAAAKPNPFIPIHLQRELKAPHCSAQRELEYSQIITDRIIHSAKHVHISWHQHKEDKQVQPSPLIPDCDTMTTSEQQHKVRSTLNSPQEKLDDHKAPQISTEEAIRGGSFILKSQASCPFKAFAEIRLQARPLQHTIHGLSALQRGTIVHAILENIWRKLKNSASLALISNDKLDQLIEYNIEAVLNDSLKPQQDITGIYLDTEKIRLKQILTQWMNHEKQRGDFTVTAIEEAANITIGPLQLRLKIDRIDQLSDGSTLLIDYKTNAPSIQGWINQQLSEPQLPLYSITKQGHAAKSICYAEIKSHQVQFKGISECNAAALPSGIKPIDKIKTIQADDWNALRDQWQTKLLSLSTEFHQGHAEVAPSNPTTCQFCHLHSFCRIHSS